MAKIDPHIQGLLDAMAESGFALPDPMTPESLRAILDNPIPGPPVEIAEQRDITIGSEAGELSGRLYRSGSNETLPVILFFHGGGWVHGTLETHDRLCAMLAVQGCCAVISVDYRLAPEHPFPAALDDAMMSLRWIKDNQAALGIDASRIALSGDSSGANIAAALAQAAAGDPDICHQLLFYPALDGRCETPSYKLDHAGFLSAAQMRWYWEQYAPGDLRSDPRASLALSKIDARLTPATLITAGHDPLRDDGTAYAERLEAAGVSAVLHDFPGAIHGFASLFGIVPLADEAIDCAGRALREAFGQ
ncbi:MAG: alpha/beta hydrolase [Hellea sp.]